MAVYPDSIPIYRSGSTAGGCVVMKPSHPVVQSGPPMSKLCQRESKLASGYLPTLLRSSHRSDPNALSRSLTSDWVGRRQHTSSWMWWQHTILCQPEVACHSGASLRRYSPMQCCSTARDDGAGAARSTRWCGVRQARHQGQAPSLRPGDRPGLAAGLVLLGWRSIGLVRRRRRTPRVGIDSSACDR
jgi:hypothetical protein